MLYKNVLEECKAELLECFSDDIAENLSEIKRYKKAFPNFTDYNIYCYGNIRPCYSQIRDFFTSCGVDTKKESDDFLCELYKMYIRKAVDSILIEEKRVVE